MASRLAQLQTRWFIDPANISTTASDANTGDSSTAALRTWAELLRRVGPVLEIETALGITVTYLSDAPEDDPAYLDVLFADPGARFQILASHAAPIQTGSASSVTPKNRPTNTLPLVVMAGVTATPAEEITHLIRDTTTGQYVAFVADTGNNAQILQDASASANASGVVSTGDALEKVLPRTLTIGKLRAISSQSHVGTQQLSVQGFLVEKIEHAEHVHFAGCILLNRRIMTRCRLNACTVYEPGQAPPFGELSYNLYDGSFLRFGFLGQGDILTDRGQNFIRTAILLNNEGIQIEEAMSRQNGPGDGLLLRSGSSCFVNANNGIFGQDCPITIEPSATLVRFDSTSITMSGAAVSFVTGAPPTGTYTPESLVPPGPAVSAAGNTWAALNGAPNWIYQPSGARITNYT